MCPGEDLKVISYYVTEYLVGKVHLIELVVICKAGGEWGVVVDGSATGRMIDVAVTRRVSTKQAYSE